jgi:hypothetical protein
MAQHTEKVGSEQPAEHSTIIRWYMKMFLVLKQALGTQLEER